MYDQTEALGSPSRRARQASVLIVSQATIQRVERIAIESNGVSCDRRLDVSKTDAALSLESDRLEQYLETATPAQPVVVIQYRNRGVSSWVFFTLLVVIPLGAILIYHRLVVERYRVQAMIESRRARAVAAPSPAQTTVVPAPAAVTTAVSPAPVPAPQLPGAAQSEAHAPAPDPAPTQAQENSALIAASAQPSPPAESPPTGAGKKREPRLRTILPNPFAPDDHPTAASTKPDGTALAALAGTVRASAGAPSSEPGAE